LLLWRSYLIKFNFAWGSAPDPTTETYSALPDPLVVVEKSLKILEKVFDSPGILNSHKRGTLTWIYVSLSTFCFLITGLMVQETSESDSLTRGTTRPG